MYIPDKKHKLTRQRKAEDNSLVFYSENETLIINFSTLDNTEEEFLLKLPNITNIKSTKKTNTLKKILLRLFNKQRLNKVRVLTENNNNLTMNKSLIITTCYNISNNLVTLQIRYHGNQNDKPRFKSICNSITELHNQNFISKLDYGDQLYLIKDNTDYLAMLSSKNKPLKTKLNFNTQNET